MPRIYAWNKALIRIYRKLRGDTIDPDVMELGGEDVTTTQAWSGIAEILQESGLESLVLPGLSLSGNSGVNGTLVTSGSVTAEDLVAKDDILGGDDLNITGTATVEDLVVRDNADVDNLDVGTGTLYAGDSRVGVGGFSDAALYGNGSIVLGIGPASVRPTGTLSHLGGVLFAEGGSLMWLGSSGTVTTVAGS